MKAAVVISHGRLEIQDAPAPPLEPFEALVKIEACGLCGTTDRHIIEGHLPFHPADQYPAILGHESVGTVVETGRDVRKFRVGDRVTRPAAIWPGLRRDGLFSAWGGFAEFGLVRDCAAPRAPAPDFVASRQHVVPPELSLPDAVASISLAEVASWMEKLGSLRDAHVVIGGSGFAACVMAQCARASGARTIIVLGRSAKKFEWTKRNGATHGVAIDENTQAAVRDLTEGIGAHWFLDAAGHQAVFEKGLTCLRPGGKAAIYGAPDDYSYRVPLGAAGGDFDVKIVQTADDVFFDEACRRLRDGRLDASLVRSHLWHGLEALPGAVAEQISGSVLKGMISIGHPQTV